MNPWTAVISSLLTYFFGYLTKAGIITQADAPALLADTVNLLPLLFALLVAIYHAAQHTRAAKIAAVGNLPGAAVIVAPEEKFQEHALNPGVITSTSLPNRSTLSGDIVGKALDWSPTASASSTN